MLLFVYHFINLFYLYIVNPHAFCLFFLLLAGRGSLIAIPLSFHLSLERHEFVFFSSSPTWRNFSQYKIASSHRCISSDHSLILLCGEFSVDKNKNKTYKKKKTSLLKLPKSTTYGSLFGKNLRVYLRVGQQVRTFWWFIFLLFFSYVSTHFAKRDLDMPWVLSSFSSLRNI